MPEKHDADNNKINRRSRHKESRRNAILDVAEQIFSRKDYHDATLDEIAQAACLSKAAIYLYFENKIELFLSVVERKLLQLGEVVQKAIADCDDVVAAIKRVIVVELAFFNDNVEFFMVIHCQRSEIQFQAKLSDDEIKERILPIIYKKIDAVAECIKCGQESGVFLSVNPREAAFMLSALIHTCVFMHVTTPDEHANLLDKADLVSKIFLDGLLVRE